MLHHLNPAPAVPKRVVIVGAGGFVGTAIATRLEREKIPVLRVTRGDVDLLAPDAGDRLGRLLHDGDAFVAASAMAPCKNASMLRDNMSLALALVQASSNAEVSHIVNISSDAVYADSDGPLTESSLAAPDSLHGIMHFAREGMFRAETRAPLAILRPSLLYGAADPHNGYGPNRFRRLANKGETITLFGEGEERRDHVLIDDVAELACRVILRRSTGILNIATGDVTSFRDIAGMAVRLSGRDVPITSSPRGGPMPHNGYRPFDAATTRNAFPGFTYTKLEQGMVRAQREAASS